MIFPTVAMNGDASCDALVFFGATGDLAFKQIFPALQALVRRGHLDVPVIGVANAGWGVERLRERARESVEQHATLDERALARLGSLLRYVDGDYRDPQTFAAIRRELDGAQRPLHYLAIPPSLFASVTEGLRTAGCAQGARVVVEKPFGRDLSSARELNRALHGVFAEEQVFRMRGHKPRVLVLDLNMPGGSSLEAIPTLREISPTTEVVVLTMQNEPAFARAALQAGALGYVLKEAADGELVQAVRMAARGKTYLNPQLGARLAAEPAQSSGGPDDLTEREVEVLRLIALGHTNTEIGEQLYLSVRTVESHRAHIQQKLQRSSRAELVRYAIEHGLVKL